MATPPVFSAGAVLTAAQMNAVGLWKIAGASFTAVNTIDITGFSSDYEYFQLVLKAQRVDAVGSTTLSGQLYSGATQRATAYYGSTFYTNYLAASGNNSADNNATSFYFCTADSGSLNIVTSEMRGMTSGNFCGTVQQWESGAARSIFGGFFHNVSETNDKIRLTATSTNTVTGNWRLYGYREP